MWAETRDWATISWVGRWRNPAQQSEQEKEGCEWFGSEAELWDWLLPEGGAPLHLHGGRALTFYSTKWGELKAAVMIEFRAPPHWITISHKQLPQLRATRVRTWTANDRLPKGRLLARMRQFLREELAVHASQSGVASVRIDTEPWAMTVRIRPPGVHVVADYPEPGKYEELLVRTPEDGRSHVFPLKRSPLYTDEGPIGISWLSLPTTYGADVGFHQWVPRSEGGETAFLIVDGALMGAACATLSPRNVSESKSESKSATELNSVQFELLLIFVHEFWAGRGYGCLLELGLERMLRKRAVHDRALRGATHVEIVGNAVGHRDAVRFYQRLGFELGRPWYGGIPFSKTITVSPSPGSAPSDERRCLRLARRVLLSQPADFKRSLTDKECSRRVGRLGQMLLASRASAPRQALRSKMRELLDTCDSDQVQKAGFEWLKSDWSRTSTRAIGIELRRRGLQPNGPPGLPRHIAAHLLALHPTPSRPQAAALFPAFASLFKP